MRHPGKRGSAWVCATGVPGNGEKDFGSGGFEGRPPRNIRYTFYAILALFVFLLYHKVSSFGFINYDDDMLLTKNIHVNSGFSWGNLIWSFTSVDKLQWVPITWISHMLDFQVFGHDASGHHLVNVAFHLLNTLLLQLFLFKTTNDYWKSYFVSAVFALHPLHVEPVAWISARKDVLSTTLFFLTLMCYVHYIEKKGTRRYVLALGIFVLGLMAKPMLVTLPFLLLLLDYWPLARIEFAVPACSACTYDKKAIFRLFYEKTPFFCLSGVFSVVSYVSQSSSNAISTLKDVGVFSRISNVNTSYATYIWKMLWPEKLAVIYPLRSSVPSWEVVAASVFLLLATALSFLYARKYRYLFVGWFWYLGTLLPVIGIVQIGPASTADKFTYIPLIGLFIVIAWGIPEILAGWKYEIRGVVIAVLATLVLIAMAYRSYDYLDCWKSSISLYNEALEKTEGNYLAMNNLGVALEEAGRNDDAIRQYNDSIRANPKFEMGYYNIGRLMMWRGDCEKAIQYFQRAIEIRPDYMKAKIHLDYCKKMVYGKSGSPHQVQIMENAGKEGR